MPLPSSFWLDETVTAFIVRHDASHPSLETAPQVTASVYYHLPGMSVALLGESEGAYRLPSLLAMLAALFFIGSLAARLIHPGAAWFAVFASLGLNGINYQAADARPYALGTCVAAGSFFFLVRWLDLARRNDALLFLLFAGLLWRVHLIYWPLYIVFALYAAVRLARSETPVHRTHAAVCFGLLLLALLPVLLTALPILRDARAHAFAPIPGARDLFNSFKFGLLVPCGTLAALFRIRTAVSVKEATTKGKGSRGSSLTLVGGWWLVHPVCLFLYSRISGNSVFLDRYLSVALPGTVLAAAFAAALLIPPSRWKQVSLVLGAGVLIVMGQWNVLWPRHDTSDWRGAAQQLHALNISLETPVITPSPFLEARPPVWRPDYPLPGFLYAHLDAYPVPGKLSPFPFERTPEALPYALSLLSGSLIESGRFAIYGKQLDVEVWTAWFAARTELAGWRHQPFGPFGNVGVALFASPAEHPAVMKLDNEQPAGAQ